MTDVVNCSVSAGIAEVRLQRPERLNALNPELMDGLLRITESLARRRGLRAVVLYGEGRGFCAGLDLDVFRSQVAGGAGGQAPLPTSDGPGLAACGQSIVTNLRHLPVPVIAAIHGPAIGGGLQIALGADLRIVAPDARLGLREIDFGITPDMGGTQLLPRLVGADHALELIVSGRLVSGSEAVSLGLATTADADPLQAARAFAAMVSGRSPTAVSDAKALVGLAQSATLAEGMAAELAAMTANGGSANQLEAAAAHFQKRSASFPE